MLGGGSILLAGFTFTSCPVYYWVIYRLYYASCNKISFYCFMVFTFSLMHFIFLPNVVTSRYECFTIILIWKQLYLLVHLNVYKHF